MYCTWPPLCRAVVSGVLAEVLVPTRCLDREISVELFHRIEEELPWKSVKRNEFLVNRIENYRGVAH